MAALPLAVTPSRVHLVDAYPRASPHNLLVRGNNPVTDKAFNLSALVEVIQGQLSKECGVALPGAFRFVDLDLENPTDPGYFPEREYFKEHPDQGSLLPWPTLGSIIEPKHTPEAVRQKLVGNGSWAVQGDSDHLPERLLQTHTMLRDTSGPPTLFYAHCNAGCDRTGEFIGAYALSYLGYNVTTAYGEACAQCGRCPNYYATQALGWWCLSLEAQGRAGLGDCLDFAGCKFLGDCDAHAPTPLADDCPRAEDPATPSPHSPGRERGAATGPPTTLASAQLKATFGARGLASVALLGSPSVLTVEGDEFAVGLNGSLVSSAALPDPTKTLDAAGNPTFRYAARGVAIDVAYEVRDAHVTKRLTVTSVAAGGAPYNVTNVTLFAGARLALDGAAPRASLVARSPMGLKDFALFARWAAQGALLTARNPYLAAAADDSGAVWLSYAPMLPVAPAAPFAADAAHLALYVLAQRDMAPPAQPLDVAEHAAMQRLVRAAVAAPPRNTSVKIHIGWCENDFQIDIATAEGRAEYMRIIDRAAELGVRHLLFAPRNSDVSDRRNGTDAWGWEQILWFGLGERLRMGLWRPGDALPASLQQMLAHFRLRGVRPVAYVYPILGFLAGTLPNGASPPWIVQGTYAAAAPAAPRDGPAAAAAAGGARRGVGGITRADLASPALQRWLPATMLAFANQTGAGGFSFDYTYFEQGAPGGTPWESQYAQWHGWRAILAALQAPGACAGAQCVVDNRQASHAWGPWMWAQGGTYAEPLQSDEQPGSWMFYEADLHTDRLAANRQRETAWSYRVDNFAPAELVPGFALHQTDRDASPRQKNVTAGPGCPHGGGDGRCAEASRRRDFDLLGYRYSLLAAVGTGGANLVLNGLPARDAGEFAHFPPEDVAFFNRWLEWTDAHRALLASTRVLPNASRPGLGSVDGVSLLRDDGSCAGAIFAFNPTATPQPLALALDATLGCAPPPAGAPGAPLLLARQIGSSDRSEPAAGWARQLLRVGDTLALALPPTTALVLELVPWDAAALAAPLLLGAAAASCALGADGALVLTGVLGEQGAPAELSVLLPAGSAPPTSATLNGRRVAFAPLPPPAGAAAGAAVSIRGTWAGARFGRAQQVGTAAGFGGGAWSGAFSVPAAALAQLAARNASYPLRYDLDPASNDEANVPWLAPGRLLVWAKYAPLLDDAFNATGAIDGRPLLMRKAYNTIVPSKARFIGYWADATGLVRPGAQQTLTLTLPPPAQWTARTGYLAAGNDLELASGSVAAALRRCEALPHCAGLTFAPEGGARCADAVEPGSTLTAAKIYLKASTAGGGGAGWCSLLRPQRLQGVHFENVESLLSADAELLQGDVVEAA